MKSKRRLIEIWHSVKSKITFAVAPWDTSASLSTKRHYMFEGYVSRTTYNMLIRIGKIAPYANYTCLQQAGE